ncbi:hypothetical protein [Cuniculiplasma divulgatum]|uniref:hypothetical protein n=1 Tax=Cuniculiplasma divulgatum TaxID=1673428 RepID=UPI0011E5CC1E|nr:hypothetical protein [Cuniculiplasma divulgatum]
MVFVGRLLEILISFDNLADVKIEDKNDLMDSNLHSLVDRSINKVNKKIGIYPNNQPKLPESLGHIQIKNEIVQNLKGIGIDTYPEVVYYENEQNDFYNWQRQELRNKLDGDGILGYGNVSFGY